MRDQKRRKLEARGWRLGTAREFLRLSAEEAAYIDLKVRLAIGLRANDGRVAASPRPPSHSGSDRANRASLRWRPAIRPCRWIC